MTSVHAVATYEFRPHCGQPACLMQRGFADRREFAGRIVRLLAGAAPGDIEPGCACIAPGRHCADCALGILEGKRALPTRPEWERLDRLGRWHQRRERRRARN